VRENGYTGRSRSLLQWLLRQAKNTDKIGPPHALTEDRHVETNKLGGARCVRWKANCRNRLLLTDGRSDQLCLSWLLCDLPPHRQVSRRQVESIPRRLVLQIENSRQLHLREKGAQRLQRSGASSKSASVLLPRREFAFGKINAIHAGWVAAVGSPGGEQIIRRAPCGEGQHGDALDLRRFGRQLVCGNPFRQLQFSGAALRGPEVNLLRFAVEVAGRSRQAQIGIVVEQRLREIIPRRHLGQARN